MIPSRFRRAAIAALAAFVFHAAPAAAAVLTAHAALTVAPRFVSVPAANAAIDFGVHLPLRNRAELERLVDLQSDPESPLFRHWLSPAQFRASFAPASTTIAMVGNALRAQGMTITKVDSQLIHVRATAATVARAFSVHLGNVRDRSGRTVLATREQVAAPAAFAAAGATIVGLGYHVLPQPQSIVRPLNRYSSTGGYWFDDLKQAYAYPAYPTLDGSGMTIATVGYSDFSSADAKAYFGHELLGSVKGSLAPAPVPKHLVFPDSLAFDPYSGTSDEADLDVQQANGSAPGATVVGFAAPATNAEGFLYVYSYIVDNDDVDIVSTSYGECELFYTPAYNNGTSYVDILKSYHDMFLQGNTEGITFIFSSGDDSARSCPQPGYVLNPGTGASYEDVPGTSIWSDDPNVTSVGGTNLVTATPPNPTASPFAVTSSAYVSEEAIADRILSPIDPYGTGNVIRNALWGSGGGPSVIFGAPSYQASARTGSTMRVDPDVSMHMGGCPGYTDAITGNPAREICNPDDSFDYAIIGGQFAGLIGTSASAPEFAGLLAVKEQQLGGARLGNANVYIYKTAKNEATNHAYHQGIPGSNGVVTVNGGRAGYNQIVGVGTPDGLNFIGVPRGIPAGIPQTPTNP